MWLLQLQVSRSSLDVCGCIWPCLSRVLQTPRCCAARSSRGVPPQHPRAQGSAAFVIMSAGCREQKSAGRAKHHIAAQHVLDAARHLAPFVLQTALHTYVCQLDAKSKSLNESAECAKHHIAVQHVLDAAHCQLNALILQAALHIYTCQLGAARGFSWGASKTTSLRSTYLVPRATSAPSCSKQRSSPCRCSSARPGAGATRATTRLRAPARQRSTAVQTRVSRPWCHDRQKLLRIKKGFDCRSKCCCSLNLQEPCSRMPRAPYAAGNNTASL